MKRGMMALGILGAALAGWIGFLTACATNKNREPKMEIPAPVQAERWSASDYSAMAVQGQTVFAKQCARCHTVDGLANVAGPDLSDYGSEEWTHLRTSDFIADPQRYYPGTKMPSFGAKYAKSKDETLTDRQIDDVTAYISSLKQRADYLPENQRK